MTMNNISIIVPFYNEALILDRFISELNNYFEKNIEINAEVVFVDDGSDDNSSLIIRNGHHLNYSAKLIRLSSNKGSHLAFRAGLLHAKQGIVTLMSVDLQHPFELFETMLNKIGNNVHWVVAVRNNQGSKNFFELLFSKTYTRLIRRYASPNFPDNGADLFMIDQTLKDYMNNQVETNSSILLQLLSYGFPFESITYNKKQRQAGKTKWTLKKKIKLFIDTFVAFSYTPIRFVSIVGILFFLAGIFWTILIISRKLLFNDVASGWTALTSILLMGFGITNISLGIIAEYLWRTLDVSRKRPPFIIEEIVELK
jgi:polyisoprenyl-phosphate glycosyltransferase